MFQHLRLSGCQEMSFELRTTIIGRQATLEKCLMLPLNTHYGDANLEQKWAENSF